MKTPATAALIRRVARHKRIPRGILTSSRRIARFAALLLLLPIALAPVPTRAEAPRIGMTIYNGTDAFMGGVFADILAAGGDAVSFMFLDSENSQIIQNGQVEELLQSNVDALIINPVDRMAVVYLIRMIAPTGVPVVFVNREPLYEDLMLYDKAYYVGNNPKGSGQMCGELIAEYFAAHPEADKNGDGAIQYVMLKGEPGHQDAELRTVYSVQALEDAGFKLERLAEDTAMWDRTAAQDKMAGYLSSFGDRIECVIANNDEMALGAIEALKAAGYFTGSRTIPVVGVDATRQALQALRDQTLLGTVLNDAQGLSDAALTLALLLAEGKEASGAAFPYAIDRGRYIWTESRKITLATLEAQEEAAPSP